jgi:hypothetical protein
MIYIYLVTQSALPEHFAVPRWGNSGTLGTLSVRTGTRNILIQMRGTEHPLQRLETLRFDGGYSKRFVFKYPASRIRCEFQIFGYYSFGNILRTLLKYMEQQEKLALRSPCNCQNIFEMSSLETSGSCTISCQYNRQSSATHFHNGYIHETYQ